MSNDTVANEQPMMELIMAVLASTREAIDEGMPAQQAAYAVMVGVKAALQLPTAGAGALDASEIEAVLRSAFLSALASAVAATPITSLVDDPAEAERMRGAAIKAGQGTRPVH
jgi:hypothetical protein